MAFSTSNAVVNVAGSVTAITQKNSVATAANTVAGVGSATIGTVTALKVWRVIAITLVGGATGVGTFQCKVKAGSTTLLEGSGNASATGQDSINISFDGSYADAIPVAAGVVIAVEIVSNAGSTATGTIFYVEEAA